MTTVQLFITCLVDSFYPETGEAIVRILRRLGLSVDVPPDQTCCGQPPFNAGLRAEARPIVEHTIRVFEKTVPFVSFAETQLVLCRADRSP